MGNPEVPSEKEGEGQVPVPQPPRRVLHPELHTTATTPTPPTVPTQPASPGPRTANESTPGSALSWIKRQILGPGRRAPTKSMSVGQAAYVFGMHGVGSLVISGGVNFGIACGESPLISYLLPPFCCFPFLYPFFSRFSFLFFFSCCPPGLLVVSSPGDGVGRVIRRGTCLAVMQIG